MIRSLVALTTVAAFVGISQIADAHGDTERPLVERVFDKCVAEAAANNTPNGESGCRCFADALSPADSEVYMTIASDEQWQSSATDSMKAAAHTCFPGLY